MENPKRKIKRIRLPARIPSEAPMRGIAGEK